ncbi:MAG: IS5/IS1182 family transposase, partial [Thermoplasmatales archaeon]
PVVKIRKNASADLYRKGGKYRRSIVREYKNLGYERWSSLNNYGMRWPGTEGIFSAVKRKFGENTVSRSEEGLLAEGYQRFWVYDEMREYGEVHTLNNST